MKIKNVKVGDRVQAKKNMYYDVVYERHMVEKGELYEVLEVGFSVITVYIDDSILYQDGLTLPIQNFRKAKENKRY